MSKKIRTIEQLETCLQNNLAWRKKEIISFKVLIENGNANEEVLLRLGIVLLCAHFEGFIKDASNYYIKYVSAQRIKIRELRDNFAAIQLEDEFKNVRETEKHSVHKVLLGKYFASLNSPFSHDRDSISTHSNPSTKVLEEILASLGLASDIFDLKAKYIDYDLLNNRHKVAHGERYPINKKDFETTFVIIMELLDQYNDLIIHAVENKKYLRENEKSTVGEENELEKKD